jgi:hypothetical protein
MGERQVIERVECEVGPVYINLSEPRPGTQIAVDDWSPDLPWAMLGRCHLRFIFPGGAVRSKTVYAKHQYIVPFGEDHQEFGEIDQVAGQEAVYAEVCRHLSRHGLDDVRPEVRIGEVLPAASLTAVPW